MHLRTLKKITCKAILKTVGVRGDYEMDKILGLKELVGYWVNGDKLMPCITNSLFVMAKNFGGFSIGPGLGPSVTAILWFLDFPMDFEMIKDVLPKHNKANNKITGNALYVYPASHAATTGLLLGGVPGLSDAINIVGSLKSKK